MKNKISKYTDQLWRKLDDWSDYLLPAAVNEAKQMVNSKIFSSIFLFGTLIFLFTSVFLFVIPLDTKSGPVGFLFFSGIMDVGLILLIPSMLFQNMTAERTNGSLELMSITSITPLKIVLGKWQTGLLQSIVFGSIVIPGLIFSYFFNGIAISVIIISILITFLSAQLSLLFSIFFCSLGTLRASRILLQLVALTTHLLILFFTIFLKQKLVSDDSQLSLIFSKEFILNIFLVLPVLFTAEWFLLSISVAQLSSYASNKSTWPRISYSFFIIAISILPHLLKKTSENFELFVTLLIAHCIIFYFFLIEKDELSKKLYLETTKKNGIIKNIYCKLFYPGKSSSFLLFLVLIIILWGSSYLYFSDSFARPYHLALASIPAVFGCVLFYMSIIYIALTFVHKIYPNAKFTLMFFTIIFITVLTFLVPVIFYFKSRQNDIYLVMDIFYYLKYYNNRKIYLELNLFLAALVFIPALILAVIMNHRKQESIRNFEAGERGTA